MDNLKLLIAATLFSTFGCQSSPLTITCGETDWFEMGRRDGAVGLPPQANEHRQRCAKHFNTLSESLFTSGYNNGLIEYCSVDSGYAIGRSGAKARKVCPAPLDVPFLTAVEKGLKAHALADINQKLDRRISSLNEKLNQEKPQKRGKVLLELSGLERERAANARKLDEIERQIN